MCRSFNHTNCMVVAEFTINAAVNFAIKTPSSGYIPSYPDINIAISRGYRDIQRNCHCINKAVYANGHFKGSDVKQTIYQEILNFILNLSSISSQSQFDTEHDNLCQKLTGSYNGYNSQGRPCSYDFTYGLAQKILNMTLKYLCVCQYFGRVNILPSGIEKFFHCPIDSYVLQTLHDVDSKYFNMITNSTGSWTFNGKPWSKLNGSDYLLFLDIYRNKLLPNISQLEAEFHLWTSTPGKLSNSTVNCLKLSNNNPSSLVGVLFK